MLAALALLAVAACAADPTPMETTSAAAADTAGVLPYVYVEARSRGLRAEIAVNGFPVATLDGATTFSSAENPFFVGVGNRLTVRLLPPSGAEAADESGAETAATPDPGAGFEVVVRRYPAGYDGWLGDGGEVLAETSLPAILAAERDRLQAALDAAVAAAPSDGARARLLADSSAALTVRYPLAGEVAFDTADLPSFRAELFEREVASREAVLDYAMRLRQMLRARDIDALVAETQPKMDWGNRATPQEYEPDYRAMFEEMYAEGEIQADFTRAQVVAVPVNGGRLWALSVARPPYVDPETKEATAEQEAFVYTLDPATGRYNVFSVAVGMDRGQLRIVF